MIRQSVRLVASLLRPRGAWLATRTPLQPPMGLPSLRRYFPERELMHRNAGEVFADPNDVAQRVTKIVALHDKVKDPAGVTMRCSFEELGLNELDLVEVMLMCEEEFDIEFTEEEGESVATVEDLVRKITGNFFTD